MRRYLRVYKTFFVSSFARELEFRSNFFAKIIQNTLWVVFFVLILLVVYSNTDDVAGWGRGEAFVLAATCFLMNAVVSGLFMSLMEIPEAVRKGTLDYVVAKPIDSQFWVSFRRFNFDQVGTLLAGFGMIILGAIQSGVTPSLGQWFAYSVLVAASIAIFYSFNLMLMTLAIWLVRVDNLWVLGETLMSVVRYPMDIYGTGLQRVFTYFVPLAFLATVPSRQLVRPVLGSWGGADWLMVGLGVLWALAFLTASRAFWRFAMTRYTSASS